jgi:NADPH:quinone reductase-like Zn-dependent oxidoreductase
MQWLELEIPQPDPAQTLVRVVAAGVNPTDWKMRVGQAGGAYPTVGFAGTGHAGGEDSGVRHWGHPAGVLPPFTIGMDFSGVVAALGGERRDLRVGDEVLGVAGPPHGSYAQYALAGAAVVRKPVRIDYVHAAALPIAGLTAWQPLVELALVAAGQRVLVHAAAGGVGHLAVQIAKARGAYVVGTARADKHPLLTDLGADEMIDYTTTRFEDAVDNIDTVLDPVSYEYGPRSVAVLKPGGILIDTHGPGPDRAPVRAAAADADVRFVEFRVQPNPADLADLCALLNRGLLRVDVGQVLPLSEARYALRLSESGRVPGKIVLTT